jgi:hypothetical protein
MNEDSFLYPDILRENHDMYEELFVRSRCTERVLRDEGRMIKERVPDSFM